MKELILQHIPDHPWRDSIVYFDTIDSTNTQAKALAAAGAPHGTVLIADSQTGGRGRLGRSFLSPAGTGIYLSVILRPGCKSDALMHLTCACGAAMCDAVEKVTGLRPGIKWINDLVIGKKKLGGILTELSVDTRSGLTRYAVVGIGINCSQKAADFPPELSDIATSLAIETEKAPDRAALAAAMIQALWEMDNGLLTRRDAIMDAYRADCVTIGQAVSVHHFNEIRYGTALDVDREGALLVQFSDGHTETVNAGEVSVRGMYGYV